MSWLGLDIGGANLKAATASGWAQSVPFALWRNPQGLAAALHELIQAAPDVSGLAVTMTGELCDCFPSKSEGVRHILAAVKSVGTNRVGAVYLTDGRFATYAAANGSPQVAAASNWRALAEFARRFVDGGSGLLIDVGSTTTDIIPIEHGAVAARGRTDLERLVNRELIYAGVGRTPVCAVIKEFTWLGAAWPLAAEVFSTTADAFLVLRKISEDSDARWTADGRPLTIACARQRLARQMCADAEEVPIEQLLQLAAAVERALLQQLVLGIVAVTATLHDKASTVRLVSGSGEFLAREASLASGGASGRIVALGERLGGKISRVAPAYAVAVLAEEADAATGRAVT